MGDAVFLQHHRNIIEDGKTEIRAGVSIILP